MKKKKLSVKLLDLIMDIKQVITLNFKLKLPIICPYPFNEFYDTLRDSYSDMVDNYLDNISLTDEEIKHIE